MLVKNHSQDSRRWLPIRYRTGDIIIGSWAKSGTTWLQKLVAELLLPAGTVRDLSRVSPWVEHRAVPLISMIRDLESQRHRRFFKTHLPFTALPMNAATAHLYVSRDPRDAVLSWFRHHQALLPSVYEQLASVPDCIGPRLKPPETKEFAEYFRRWLYHDGYPLWPYWQNVRSWWEARTSKNVLLLRFEDMRRDSLSALASIASFLDCEISNQEISAICARSSFLAMKSGSSLLVPSLDVHMERGSQAFFNTGEHGHGGKLIDSQLTAELHDIAHHELGRDCAAWLFCDEEGECTA